MEQKIAVSKSEPVELTTVIDAQVRLYKDLKTGKITGEIYIDNGLWDDFHIGGSQFKRIDGAEWVEFFTKQFDQ